MIRSWRVCWLLAVCCSVYAVAVASAVASPNVTRDLGIAYRAAPHGPCAGHLRIHWKTMSHADGSVDEADLGPGLGMRVVKIGDGPERLLLLSCDIALNPSIVDDAVHECDVIVHEYLHTAGHRHEEGGVMTPYTGTWAPCHPLNERVTARVLGLVPRGWAMSCGARRGRVVRCRADDGRGHSRRFRVRLADRAGTTFAVKRIGS